MAPVLRPVLLPGLPRVWRDPHTLQLGHDPARALLLDLPDPRAAFLLDLLDGTRSERGILTAARHHGLAAADTRALLAALHAAGLVWGSPTLVPPHLAADTRRRLMSEATALAFSTPPPSGTGPSPDPPGSTAGSRCAARGVPTPATRLRRRAAARVVLGGRGRLAAPIAVLLAGAGVGHVFADVGGTVRPEELGGGPLAGDDVGRGRREAIADAVLRAAPDTLTRPVQRGHATLVVQLAHDEPVALVAAGHAQRRQPYLAVALREGTPVIGPLTVPGRPPCPHCIDLHRRDRDPTAPPVSPAKGPEPCAATTLLAAAAYVAAEILLFVEGGRPETVGATVDVPRAGRLRRRTWPPHPGCGCARPSRDRGAS